MPSIHNQEAVALIDKRIRELVLIKREQQEKISSANRIIERAENELVSLYKSKELL